MECSRKDECPLAGKVAALSKHIGWLVEQEKKRAEKPTLRQKIVAWRYNILVALRLKKPVQKIQTIELRSNKAYTFDL